MSLNRNLGFGIKLELLRTFSEGLIILNEPYNGEIFYDKC